jgi:hypothetical protein
MRPGDVLMNRMLRFLAGPGICLGILLSAVVAGGGPPPPAPAPAEVDRAIERATTFLRGKQEPDGSVSRDLGKTALLLYALAHAGVPAADPAMARGTAFLFAALARPDTYGASAAIMALATLDPEAHAKRVERIARLIESAQCDNGQWSYRLSRGRAGGDNSNTQFALLALWYATQCGVKVEPAVFGRTLHYFLGTQNEDGGFGYSARERKSSYGSMTATGLAALVVCRAGLERRELKARESRRGEEVTKAVAWLRDHLALDRNPEANFRLSAGRAEVKQVTDAFWRHYWLWSLERAMALAGVGKLGDRDWYAEGAKHLLSTQRDDGSWVGSEAAFEATCFATLFLTRSMRRAVATEKPVLLGPVTPEPK